ncbi:MAG TPA: nuclear transport factor 2 family protein [Acidimicrobiales bacterium]|nr:nuclear transport factor 2 family protein [Acidimicrobiales bacterium]
MSEGGTVTDNGMMADRLQRLEDLEEIRQLFVDYGHHLDSGDFAAYGALFADEGEVLLGPVGRAKGPAAIEALMRRTLEGAQGSSFHIVSNPIIDLHGDRATSEVMWTVVARDKQDSAAVTMLGRHRDTLTREGGRWRFLRREGFIDVPSRYRTSEPPTAD